jgi:hypothetical protein
MHKIIVTKQTSHDLEVSSVNLFVIIYTIFLTKCISSIPSPYFSLNMQFLKVYSHFICFAFLLVAHDVILKYFASPLGPTYGLKHLVPQKILG